MRHRYFFSATLLCAILWTTFGDGQQADNDKNADFTTNESPTTKRTGSDDVPRKRCSGTKNGMSIPVSMDEHLKRMQNIYTNCTIVEGNIEITGIKRPHLQDKGWRSLDFFTDIEEVKGYVMIYDSDISEISFPKLRIIWGEGTAPLKPVDIAGRGQIGNISLFVMNSNIDVLDFRSLRAIVDGNVVVTASAPLCYWKWNRMDWNQILEKDASSRVAMEIRDNGYCKNFEDMMKCHDTCGGYCWGHEAYHCQIIYRTNCAAQCPLPMCYQQSTNPQYCCSKDCVAGCFGPGAHQCYGCRKFRDGGACVNACPPLREYSVKDKKMIDNKDGKYASGRDCVKRCPLSLSVFEDKCVTVCPKNMFETFDHECKPCDGECPKVCKLDMPIYKETLEQLTNCTYIDGRIEITDASFKGTSLYDDNDKFQRNVTGITMESLEVLSTVQRVSQYVYMDAPNVTSLSFLRNLQQIDGREKQHIFYSLTIYNTSLTELGMKNLRRVLDGQVTIAENPHLCYANTLPWKNISHDPSQPIVIIDEKGCAKQGKTCDPLCEQSTGCWAGGPAMCFKCKTFEFEGTCVDDCSSLENTYVNGTQCLRCHEQCAKGCNGPYQENCFACKNVRLNGRCEQQCPNETHYENRTTRECKPCHENCHSYGCTGPENRPGEGGCNKCLYGLMDDSSSRIVECMWEVSAYITPCSSYPNLTNYYSAPSDTPLATRLICKKCKDVCKACTADTDDAGNKCECKAYIHNKDRLPKCVLERPRNTYAVGNTFLPCHTQCDECTGPESTDCKKCVVSAHYLNDNKTVFNCTRTCPPNRAFVVNGVCTGDDPGELKAATHRRLTLVIGVVLAVIFVLLLVVCTVAFMWRRRFRAMKFLQPDDIFELNPDAKPNLSRLQLISETQLKQGGLLGYGAFGEVYKGIWCPPDTNIKVPVAIKVLRESNADAQKEMLDEAGIMASMEHQHLLRLFGVCVANKLMIVTPLVPLGNLLDYVQKNQAKIGSLALLRWCTQIATGMQYLEESRLVHRDLAARNVLVQTPYHVRITDFGLAKMLDYGEQELQVFGEKMPIKWLALECIQYKKYTHKSDVWAYGVTVWELMTFGEKPYAKVPLLQIPNLLERGERLQQPKICTLDVYMILIKCWMVDADTRPSFSGLAESFGRMAKDPGRYLVIEGDALLRLPSYTSGDQKHMLAQLVDDPDVRDPTDFLFSNDSPVTPLSPVSPTKPFLPDLPTNSSDTPHLREAAGRARPGHRQPSTSSHRYLSDPMKKAGVTLIERHDEESGITTPPTDPDDYLVPKSQIATDSLLHSDVFDSSSNAECTYTPIIQGAKERDYYDHLRAAVSAAGDALQTLPGFDNQVYLQPNNNNTLEKKLAKASAVDAVESTEEILTETETVV